MTAHIINSAENPYDLRPVANAIMDRIHQAVRQSKTSGTSDKPVVVIMGEEHPKPAHRLLQQAVLHLSQESGLKPVYHFEYGHHLLEKLLRQRAGFISEEIDSLKSKDANGHLLLRAFKAYHDPMRYSPSASDNLFGFCIDKGISVSFTDAARKVDDFTLDTHFFDVSDSATREIVIQHLGSNVSDIEAVSFDNATAMAIRNDMMCQNSLKSAADSKPDIIIHHCGSHHAVGDARYGFSYEESLAKKFKDEGCPVLVVYPDTNNMSDNIPAEAGQELANILLIRGLPDQSFTKHDPMEKLEVDKIIAASGGLISHHDKNSTKPVYVRRLREHAEKLLGLELV